MRRKVVVFGTGKRADEFWYDRVPVHYFVDNDQRKWGTTHRGIPVHPPQVLLNENKDEILVVIASMYAAEIAEQLESYGLQEGVHYYRNAGPALGALIPEEFDKILAFKDIHKGKRAFVIGNGPSLRIRDLDRLKDEITFASNNIFVAFPETDWRPTYYTMTDREAARNNRDKVANLLSTKLLPNFLYPYIGQNPNCFWVPATPVDVKEIRFSTNIREQIISGMTVTYYNLQLAYYMGVSEIYLLGIDFDYGPVPKFDPNVPDIYYAHKPEYKVYFHPDYHQEGENCIRPNMDAQYKCYQKAFHVMNQQGVRIWNASRSTKLDVFPRIDFDDLFN